MVKRIRKFIKNVIDFNTYPMLYGLSRSKHLWGINMKTKKEYDYNKLDIPLSFRVLKEVHQRYKWI